MYAPWVHPVHVTAGTCRHAVIDCSYMTVLRVPLMGPPWLFPGLEKRREEDRGPSRGQLEGVLSLFLLKVVKPVKTVNIGVPNKTPPLNTGKRLKEAPGHKEA